MLSYYCYCFFFFLRLLLGPQNPTTRSSPKKHGPNGRRDTERVNSPDRSNTWTALRHGLFALFSFKKRIRTNKRKAPSKASHYSPARNLLAGSGFKTVTPVLGAGRQSSPGCAGVWLAVLSQLKKIWTKKQSSHAERIGAEAQTFNASPMSRANLGLQMA